MFSAVVVALSMAFGPSILDLSLQLADHARQSLTRTPEEDVPATMTFHDAGREQTYAVMVHVKGQLGSARPLDDKPAFKIKLAKGERFLGLERLTLNNMVQDPTMLHEALGYQVYAAAGVAVPQTGYVRLTVNGQEQGLYLNVETIDRLFLERAFHDSSGILYEGAYGVDLRDGNQEKFQQHEGTDPDHAQLTALIRAVHTAGDDVFYGPRAQVDTPAFVAMLAAGALLADWDNYYEANNYRIYWQPSARRWFFIPTGIDQTFNSGTTRLFGGIGVLFQKCLASDRCSGDYAAALRDVSLRFERLGLPTRMDALLSVMGAASQADPKKPYDDGAMRSAREAMRAFIATQPAGVRGELSCLGNGGGSGVTACAGQLLTNAATGGCVELASANTGQHGAARVAPCLGGPKQRWQRVVSGEAFALKAMANGDCLEVSAGEQESPRVHQASCSGAESQLFTLRAELNVTRLVAKSSGQCLAAAPGDSKTPALMQVACGSDPAQHWRLQRSIFEEPR
jgi:CotH kinase protein/Ricin-type beta-trefoil lectin domain